MKNERILGEHLLAVNTNPPDTITKGSWIQVCYCLWTSDTNFDPDSADTDDTYGTVVGRLEENVVSKKYRKSTKDTGKVTKATRSTKDTKDADMRRSIREAEYFKE